MVILLVGALEVARKVWKYPPADVLDARHVETGSDKDDLARFHINGDFACEQHVLKSPRTVGKWQDPLWGDSQVFKFFPQKCAVRPHTSVEVAESSSRQDKAFGILLRQFNSPVAPLQRNRRHDALFVILVPKENNEDDTLGSRREIAMMIAHMLPVYPMGNRTN
jgi:hypothetical protein